jgi:transketolase
VMANMRVIVPCDSIEAKKATLAAASIWGPVYLRFSREKSPVITTDKTHFAPGKAEVFWQTKGGRSRLVKNTVAILGCGPLLYEALVAAKELEEEGVSVIVLNVHTIKPLDEVKILEVAKKYGAIVTVEEHQVVGGLGGAVAEFLAKKHPTPMEFVGMQGVFGESGAPSDLVKKYCMSAKDIKAAAKRVIRRK